MQALTCHIMIVYDFAVCAPDPVVPAAGKEPVFACRSTVDFVRLVSQAWVRRICRRVYFPLFGARRWLTEALSHATSAGPYIVCLNQ